MNSRTAGRRPGRDPGVGGDAAERFLDPRIVQPRAGAGDEQHVAGPGREQPVPFLLVSHECFRSGRVQREQPLFAGLAVADGQNAVAGVEVAVVQGDQLPDPGACRRQQADQGRVGGRADRPGPASRRRHQGADLVTGIQVRDSAVRPVRDEPGRGNLVGVIERVQPGRERADRRQAQRVPPGRPGRGSRPGDRVLDRDHVGLAFFQVVNELADQLLGPIQPEPQRPADAQVVGQRFSQRAHAAASCPGQGRATARSAVASAFA